MASVVLPLVESARSLQDLEARLNARLLAALLLVVLCMELVGTLVIAMTIYPTSTTLLLLGPVAPLLAAYALSRTKYYRLGAALSIFIFSLIPYVTIAVVAHALTSDLVFLSLVWLNLPVLLTSLFFSIRITAVNAVLINLSMLLIPALIPDVDRTAVNTALGLVLSVSVLVVVLMYHRERIERSRQVSLEESEARYRRLTENAQDIIYRYSLVPQRRITYINPAVKDILGYAPDEFYADPDLFFNLIYPNDQPALLSVTVQNALLDQPATLRWVRQDGTLAWIEHRHVPLIDRAGNLIAVEGIARDVTERKQLEETLRRSEASLAEAQRIAHFGSWTWEWTTGKLQCSDEMFRLVGLLPQAAELPQEVFLKFWPPEEAAWILQEIQHGVADAPPADIEHRIIRANGEVRYAYSRLKIYRDEHGHPLRLLGTTQDITDRKQAEAQIERNMRQLAALEHMGQTVVASLDLAVVLSRVIEEILSLLGAQGVSVLLIEDRDNLIFAATNNDSLDLIGRRMPISVGIAGEVVRSGQSAWVHDSAGQARIHRDIDQAIGFHTQSLLAVPLNLHGEIIGVMEAVHTQPGAFSADDLRLLEAAATWATVAITNARIFEAERRRVQEQAALLEITQMALSSFEFTSPVLKHIARRIAQACHASQCLLVLLEEQASAVRPVVAQYADGHEDQDIQQVLQIIAAERLDTLPALRTLMHERRPHLFKDVHQASLLPEEWWRLLGIQQALAVPLLSQADAIGLMVLAYEADQAVGDNYFDLALTIGAQIAIAFANMYLYADLQRALQHERDARAQVVQAEKLAAIGRLAASVAHELNNPLQAIQNSLYLVRQDSVLDKQAQDDLDVALTESRRMADLIERMRETYRPPTTTEFRPESLNVLIAEVEKLISTHLRHNEVTFAFQPEPQLPLALCLRDQMKQVILNLSLNAVEAMPNGGRLTISTALAPETNGLWLTFTDTGQGIAPKDLPNIFDPFFTRKTGGTGLGLAISYDIIQHHHGRIEVASEQGRGTTFRIWLPAKGT
ncbi:Sensor protein ZraS [Thermoflexales bacterium]|nr:Sensor protein ZraS [Thermoflexales bacterium]